VVNRTRFNGLPLFNEDPSVQPLHYRHLLRGDCIERFLHDSSEAETVCYLPSSFEVVEVGLHGRVCALGLGSGEVVILHLPD
jgi:hypothetical protein